MLVRMVTTECGPNGSFAIGEERTTSREHGQMLIDTKHAVFVRHLSPIMGSPGPELEISAAAEEKSKQADAAHTRKPARR